MGDFYVPGPPVPKARPRVTGKRTFTPRRTKIYEEAVHLCYQGARFDDPVQVHVTFWMSDARRVDLDNLIKSLLDGLSGRAFLNDDQVVHIAATKRIDRENPRTEGTVLPM